MAKQGNTKIKQLLEERREKIEKELSSFATKDEKVKGDYDTRFPDFDTQSLDESALKLAAYEITLPIEYALELRLVDINKALEKIKDGTYGRCEKCGKEINSKRLEIMPEARVCRECQK